MRLCVMRMHLQKDKNSDKEVCEGIGVAQKDCMVVAGACRVQGEGNVREEVKVKCR